MIQNNPDIHYQHHQHHRHNQNKNNKTPSLFPSLPYCHYLLGLTKLALTLSFLLSISLITYTSFSSLSTTTTTSTITTSTSHFHPNLSDLNQTQTRPVHILFSLSASAATWADRRLYSLLWHTPNLTRTILWFDREPVQPGLDYRVSSRTWSKNPSDRIARIVKESYELGLEDVRWFVMGDDDTVFFPENVAAVLAKYDHRRMYYVGGNSESVEQNVMHGFSTAFGGGGFAISYGLASELVARLDGCIQRYRHYYGSDEKVSACVAELGVPLTREPGFHQLDIKGDPYGFLAAHPVAPLVSLHHLDSVKPLFPGQTQVDSLKKLMKSYRVDPGFTLQQSFCYDHKRKWSVSIAWGYTAQLHPSLVSPNVLSMPLHTFRTWRSSSDGPFLFNTQPFRDDPCERPIIYYLDQVQDVGEGNTLSIYKRVATADGGGECKQLTYKYGRTVETITVTAVKSSPDMWSKAPRRQCCEITNSWTVISDLRVKIRSCKRREAMSI
ncbi:hypothetical protein KSS87_019111 [Heliosperma pusillum]|nr:hypothetical protein KSS87_019111 [Heliosperma pusillum]